MLMRWLDNYDQFSDDPPLQNPFFGAQLSSCGGFHDVEAIE